MRDDTRDMIPSDPGGFNRRDFLRISGGVVLSLANLGDDGSQGDCCSSRHTMSSLT